MGAEKSKVTGSTKGAFVPLERRSGPKPDASPPTGRVFWENDTMKAARLLAVLTVGAFSAACAFFQEYPAKSVRVIEPFGAGSGVDVVARAVTAKLSELLGQIGRAHV